MIRERSNGAGGYVGAGSSGSIGATMILRALKADLKIIELFQSVALQQLCPAISEAHVD
jgi:hypothetical protein